MKESLSLLILISLISLISLSECSITTHAVDLSSLSSSPSTSDDTNEPATGVSAHGVDLGKVASSVAEDQHLADAFVAVSGGVGDSAGSTTPRNPGRMSSAGRYYLPRRAVGLTMARAWTEEQPGVLYFRKRRGGRGYVGLGVDIVVRKNKVSKRMLCYQRTGPNQYRLATKRPCFRLSVSRGVLEPVSRQWSKHSGEMVTKYGPGKPNDPRKVMTRGKGWAFKKDMSVEQRNRFRFLNGLWYSGPGLKKAYVDFRWWPAGRVTRSFLRMMYLNNPYMVYRSGKWVARKRRYGWWRRNGVWWRSRTSNVCYVAGRWLHVDQAIRLDPNFRVRVEGSERRVTYRPLGQTRFWQAPTGRWFRREGSPYAYLHGAWVNVSRLRNWKRVCDPRRPKRCWYKRKGGPADARSLTEQAKDGEPFNMGRPSTSNRAYHHGRWVNGNLKVTAAQTRMRRANLLRGVLTKDVMRSVKAQVHRNFLRFIRWFITNYMRGGNYAKFELLARDLTPSHDNVDVEPRPKPTDALGAVGTTTFAPPPPNPEIELVDGMTKAISTRLAQYQRQAHRAVLRGRPANA